MPSITNTTTRNGLRALASMIRSIAVLRWGEEETVSACPTSLRRLKLRKLPPSLKLGRTRLRTSRRPVASHCLHRDPDSFASIPSRTNNPTGRLVDHLCDLPKDFVASVIEFSERL